MKKLIFGLIAIVIVSTGIFAFAGCEKEEESKTDNLKNFPTTAYDEVVNPDETELLNRTYTVAVYDGEQFQLTFDPELFLHNLEDYLNSHSGVQYVAEDVRIFIEEGIDYPSLNIIIYDITNDTWNNVFYSLFSDDNNDVSNGESIIWNFSGNTSSTLTCQTTTRCHSRKKTGCVKETAPDGNERCSPCLTAGVTCTETHTYSEITNAICAIL